MDWVLDGLGIGGRRDTIHGELLLASGVQAVLHLYGPEREPLGFPSSVVALELYVVDGERVPPALLREGVEFIRAQREQGRSVLVACGAGISRSTTFLAAYLHEQGMDLFSALTAVMEARPIAFPHPTLVRSLVECYHAPVSPEALLIALVKARKELKPS